MLTLILLAVLIVGLIYQVRLGFSYTPKLTIPTSDWGRDPMQSSLKAYLKKESSNTNLMIHYHIGGGLMGETDFRLRGDGGYDLWTTATKGRKRKSYSGQVEIFQVERVVQEMLATKVWQVKHIHPHRRLDDPDAMIFVSAGEQKSEVVLWVSEVRKSPPFQKVQGQLQGLIGQIYEGQVLEKARGTNEANDTLPSDVAPEVEQGERLSQLHVLASLIKRVKSRSISRGRLLRRDALQKQNE